jgi:DMSO/TMAO reductase YedYZ molybdopterin-dependent catalytic subunit
MTAGPPDNGPVTTGIFDHPIHGPAAGTRRSFQFSLVGVAALARAAAAGGRALRTRFSAASSRQAVTLPVATEPLPPAPDAVGVDIDGVSSFYTPNANFYRIDTAVEVPQVRAEEWELRIHGMVDKEIRLSYDDLLQREMVEQDITLTCVSNTVGGSLVGNARWLGTPLKALLDEAGIDPAANQIVGRSVDGWTSGFPIEALDGDRQALLAVGMNGEPLPLEHGFPARVVVAGLYGYVSATKWITELEVTTFDEFDAYWVKRGWDDRGPIKTQARIDTPRTLAKVAPGTVAIGGVAWAQTIGVSTVEVKIDDGEFAEATLADELSVNTWRLWSYSWEGATPGRHRLTVRATDANGEVQTDERADPFPNGASGWMSIFVEVTDA